MKEKEKSACSPRSIPSQLLAAINTHPLPPQPALGLSLKGNDGVRHLLEILEKVGAGIMDRQSISQTLDMLYGGGSVKAHAVVPQSPLDLRKGLNTAD